MSHPPLRPPRSFSNLAPLVRGSATFGLLFGLIAASAQCSANGHVLRINLGSFSGDDRLAAAVAETLLTDLGKSGRISVLDSLESRTAHPGEGAYVLTGSCLVFDDSVVINARIIDSETGRTVPGASENIDGPRAQVFTLVHSLAGKLTARMTNGAPVAAPRNAPATPAKRLASRPGLSSLKPSFGLAVPKISPSIKLGGGRATATAGRSRAVVVARPAPSPPPASRLPEIGVRVADDEQPLDTAGAGAREEDGDPTAGGFAPALDSTGRDDRGETSDPVRARSRPAPSKSARYTSLIVDARGLDLERSMSPAIRRRGGSVVWNGGEANPDYVISDGIVGYATSMREARDMARAGSRPLVVEAVSRHETPFPSDPYIDDEDADYLLSAARRDGFLKKFNVIFVIGR